MALTTLASVPIATLKGIGDKVAAKLSKLGIYSVEDALFHLPLRYEDRSRVYTIADLIIGRYATVVGEVQSSQLQFGKRRTLVVRINDNTGGLTLRFFNFSAAQKNQLNPGTLIRCFGEVKAGRHGPDMIHPEYRVIQSRNDVDVEDTFTPVYPTTEGVKQATLRNITEQALKRLEKYPVEALLPDTGLTRQWSLQDALRVCHRPPVDTELQLLELGTHPAIQRLAVEELVAHQLSLLKVKSSLQSDAAPAIASSGQLIQPLLRHLPFSLTGAQQRVIAEINADLQQSRPMLRLVQGDVGSGKTLVAAMAALSAIECGYQVALMAPTEILAEQHFANFSHWFSALAIPEQLVLLTGKMKVAARRDALDNIEQGRAKMIIGTHALFQAEVNFAKLALIIIDEQHRFGVHQRLELRNKGVIHSAHGSLHPHQLVMTATPIPRTLAMTAYADLDCSIIDELPPGRTPINTVAIPDTKRDDIIARVRQVCMETGQQAYWVCTLIEESEALQCQAAEDTCQALQIALPELKVGLVHGRMKGPEKQAVMAAFKAGEINLLVATTVIEVGVDVPNASLMIIENPERLGLAQLHQLRGRVGRGALQSHCVLLYHPPLSQNGQQRISVMRESNDGFYIAQQDLAIRGAGEIIGTRQTGMADFKIADLSRDEALVPPALSLANQLLQEQPHNADKLIQRWLAGKQIYANA